MDCELRLGDCLEELKKLKPNSVDSLVTDPPAGISFMGKEWDGDKGGSKQWIAWLSQVMQECLRVLKPGAHGLVWAIPRTSHWTATACEDAGFEIRDVVTHLFGSGFPKSFNIGKKTGVKEHQGLGTALKPASEHWILVRKPCSEKTIAANVLKHGCGGINIDASRIGNQQIEKGRAGRSKSAGGNYEAGMKAEGLGISSGRFPANLVLSHNPDCVEEGTKKVKGHKGYPNGPGGNTFSIGKSTDGSRTEPWNGHASPDGTETVPAFECTPGCAVAELDRQSGNLGKSAGGNSKNVGNKVYGKYEEDLDHKSCGFGDSGGASRFFKAFEPSRFTYCAKASKREKNAGCEGLPLGPAPGSKRSTPAEGRSTALGEPRANHHPTVKPLKLMTYLIKMITPPKGVVLDPFMGSGSTGVAARLEGYKFVGIEQNKEYLKIAKKRIFSSFHEFKKQLHLGDKE
jgi:DNA modification methylase